MEDLEDEVRLGVREVDIPDFLSKEDKEQLDKRSIRKQKVRKEEREPAETTHFDRARYSRGALDSDNDYGAIDAAGTFQDRELRGIIIGWTDKEDRGAGRSLLEEVYFSLPGRINALELVNFAHVQETPFKINLSPDALKFDYYLVKIPVNILLPETTKIEVLAMKAEIISMGEINREIIAYDIFPKDTPRTREIAKGNLKIGISDVLTFVPHPAIQPLSKCLDCNIEFPIKWESKSYEIETSDTGSNPVYWRVNDEFIAGCFEAYCIIQAPKGIPVSLRVNLEGKAKPSLHATLMNMIFRNPVATFRADEQIYQIN